MLSQAESGSWTGSAGLGPGRIQTLNEFILKSYFEFGKSLTMDPITPPFHSSSFSCDGSSEEARWRWRSRGNDEGVPSNRWRRRGGEDSVTLEDDHRGIDDGEDIEGST